MLGFLVWFFFFFVSNDFLFSCSGEGGGGEPHKSEEKGSKKDLINDGKGEFTPGRLIEFQQQNLIFKRMKDSLPVPVHLFGNPLLALYFGGIYKQLVFECYKYLFVFEICLCQIFDLGLLSLVPSLLYVRNFASFLIQLFMGLVKANDRQLVQWIKCKFWIPGLFINLLLFSVVPKNLIQPFYKFPLMFHLQKRNMMDSEQGKDAKKWRCIKNVIP